MEIDTSTFQAILMTGFKHLWYSQSIPHPGMHTFINLRVGRHSLNAAGGLRLVLHKLSSAMQQIDLQQTFALVSTVSRYLGFSLLILLKTLRQMPHAIITWPLGKKFLKLSGYVSMQHWLLQGVFCSINGLNLLYQVSSNVKMENAMYNSWLHSHLVS